MSDLFLQAVSFRRLHPKSPRSAEPSLTSPMAIPPRVSNKPLLYPSFLLVRLFPIIVDLRAEMIRLNVDKCISWGNMVVEWWSDTAGTRNVCFV